MSDSATPTRVERRMRQTAAGLTAACRRLTAEHGLAGFTIEEVCEAVDVSRRTFFNYFASKEDAVIGVNADDEFPRLAEIFLAQPRGDWPQVIDDLVTLAIQHFESDPVDASSHGYFMVALEREPRLLGRFIGATRERDRLLRQLIAERQGVGADDPRADAAVNIVSTMMRSSAERFIDPANTTDFATLLRTTLAAFRAVLAEPNPPKGNLS